MHDQGDSKKWLTVFCGSSHQVDDSFLQGAAEVGRLLCEMGFGVVYGGGGRGLMGSLADAVLSHGGAIHGVIPRFMIEREWVHRQVASMDVVTTMSERKNRLIELGDIIMALPGGIGTLDEFFEAVTLRQLGCHEKPLLLFNQSGYYDPLLLLQQHMHDHGFWDKGSHGVWQQITDIGQLRMFLLDWRDQWVKKEAEHAAC